LPAMRSPHQRLLYPTFRTSLYHLSLFCVGLVVL
jgi:hypothetical protein